VDDGGLKTWGSLGVCMDEAPNVDARDRVAENEGAEPVSRPSEPDDKPRYGDAWVYESMVGALPGIEVPPGLAIAIQVGVFETGVVALWWYYGLPDAGLLAGTAAVLVAALGSALMLRLGTTVRSVEAPEPYRRLLFGSGVEVVLGVLAFIALVTHLFVVDPRRGGETLLRRTLGLDPPAVVVYLTLLVLWDLAYRIGTGWWACVAALYRSLRYPVDAETARGFRRADALALSFGVAQVPLVPFIVDYPTLLVAVGGHIVAVTVVSLSAMALLTVE
jgi:hypothetical protein